MTSVFDTTIDECDPNDQLLQHIVREDPFDKGFGQEPREFTYSELLAYAHRMFYQGRVGLHECVALTSFVIWLWCERAQDMADAEGEA